MESDDEIVVAQPSRMSIGFLTSSTEHTSDRSSAEKKASSGENKQTPSENDSDPSPAVIDLTNQSRDSTPLSDVDEDILEKAPTAVLQQTASDDDLLASRSASAATDKPSVASSSPSNFTSSPQSPKANSPPRKRTRTSGTIPGAMLPPPKRKQRGRPRKTALEDSSLSRSQLDGPAAELGLDDTEDDLDVRPTTNQLLSRGGTKTSWAAARTRNRPGGDSEDEYSSKLRNRDAEKEKYEPLRLYEDSSMLRHHHIQPERNIRNRVRLTSPADWVLFDPIKSFPRQFPNPPKFMHDYTCYEPGNERVLEYNLVSNSVRIKSTPEVLQGKTVRYEQDGPKLT